ncbi:hypothetical protein MN2019_09110 [Mycolicibacterium neoaurum]|uniref:hypothetical protein n=1 Tax=Mycolicibacterium neoaurum TaxID=1795 RepID=UPI001BCFF29A|nr:hypothetical protein [Mycolicibacterium neoaurum]QVI29429.1 hypothetical protein MN2019_09110 [Mycolicibacterium neoaurum]
MTEQRRLHNSRVPPWRTASRSVADRSRRMPRPSRRRTAYRPPPRRIRAIRSMLSPCGPTDVLMGFCRRRDLDAHRLSHSWSPSTPAATTPDTIANA